MTLLDAINIGGVDYGINSNAVMGTCATPAGTEIKECLFADSFILAVGNIISVAFTYANTYGDGSTTYPKLLINGTQYPVKVPTGTYAGDGAWVNGQIVTLVCDGTNLIMATAPTVNTVANGNMNAVTSNAVYASELAIRNGSRMVTRCSKVAGDHAQHWAKLFSFDIGRQYDNGVCFFEIVGHSINKGSKISGYIVGYTQNVSDPYIWNSSNTLNNASLYYSKEVQSNGNVLITVYVPTFTDNYMWWELNLSSDKDLIIYNSPDLITDVSGLIAFITS